MWDNCVCVSVYVCVWVKNADTGLYYSLDGDQFDLHVDLFFQI